VSDNIVGGTGLVLTSGLIMRLVESPTRSAKTFIEVSPEIAGKDAETS
jgi:hypothetical protein